MLFTGYDKIIKHIYSIVTKTLLEIAVVLGRKTALLGAQWWHWSRTEHHRYIHGSAVNPIIIKRTFIWECFLIKLCIIWVICLIKQMEIIHCNVYKLYVILLNFKMLF